MDHKQFWANRRHFIASLTACALSPWAYAANTPSAARILVLGDSLSAEYGLARGTGWVALLERQLQQARITAHITNASISGETTSGGRSRLPALLKQHQPSVLVIELGANDALRGLPLNGTLDNLRAMTQAAQAAGAQVLLVGMQMPPNYGQKYAQDFEQLYVRVAQEFKTALVPAFFKNVADAADTTTLFQADRIHPTAQAQPILLANIWPHLQPLLKR